MTLKATNNESQMTMPNRPQGADRVNRKSGRKTRLIQNFQTKARNVAGFPKDPLDGFYAWYGFFLGDGLDPLSPLIGLERTLIYELCLIAGHERKIRDVDLHDIAKNFERWPLADIRKCARAVADCGYLKWIGCDFVILIHPKDREEARKAAPRKMRPDMQGAFAS